MVRKYIPDTFLTRGQLITYKTGLICENILEKISNKEWNRLIDIGIGKIPPDENSREKLRSRYPKITEEELQKKFKEAS